MSERLSKAEIDHALSLGKSIALKAGKKLKSHFNNLAWERSKGGDPLDIVTSADLDSQRLLVGFLRKNFPSYGIVGEESGELEDGVGGGNWHWTVDPLDGTVNFSAGLRLWCVAISLVDSTGNPQVSIVHCPLDGELFYAARGKGAFLNGKRIHVSGRPPQESLVSIGLSHHTARAKKGVALLGLLDRSVRRQKVLGCSSLELAYTACGRLGGCVNFSSLEWDVSPGRLLVEEAGGTVLGVRGQRAITDDTGFIGASPKLLPLLLKQCRKV